MGHGHGHGVAGAASAGRAYIRRLGAALALTAAYMVVQVVVGISSGSLALLSDAAHMGTDAEQCLRPVDDRGGVVPSR